MPILENRRLDALIHMLVDGDLPPQAADELAGLLREHPEARQRYRHALAIHSSLTRLGSSLQDVPAFTQTGIVRMPARKSPWWIPTTVAACLLLALGSAFYLNGRSPATHATLSGMTAAAWKGPMKLQQDLAAGNFHDLTEGFAEVSYRNGVKVILEAPCRFEVSGEHSMNLTHGRASVKVPKSVTGFDLDTPGGRITDLGTEFGVAVGFGTDGPVVLSEVYDGEIEIPGAADSRRRLKRGESIAILRENGSTRLATTLENQPVSVANPARRLPPAQTAIVQSGNLALGKPVFSPSYYTGRTGETFPPDKLTDGRLNDSGSPGDWPFWLAPNGVAGEFTVDLLEPSLVGRIDLQNTRNRNHGDRGLRDFLILVSTDNREFTEVAHGELQAVRQLPPPGTDIPFESITIAPVTARYVKVVGLSHYRNEFRPKSDPNEGGGLNEIRIFSR